MDGWRSRSVDPCKPFFSPFIGNTCAGLVQQQRCLPILVLATKGCRQGWRDHQVDADSVVVKGRIMTTCGRAQTSKLIWRRAVRPPNHCFNVRTKSCPGTEQGHVIFLFVPVAVVPRPLFDMLHLHGGGERHPRARGAAVRNTGGGNVADWHRRGLYVFFL
jgi:hypothetical protein